MRPEPPRGATAARVAKNTIWLSAARVGTKLLSLPLVIILARELGPEGFGQWALVMSLVAILAMVAEGGFQTLTIRDLAPRPGRAWSYLVRTMRVRLVLSFLAGAGLVVWGISVEGGRAPAWIFVLGAVLLFPETFIRAGQAVVNARERMGLTSGLSLAQAGLTTLVVGGVVLAGAGVSGGLAALLAVNAAAAVAIVWVIRPFLLRDEAETQSAWRLFVTAFPYGLMALLVIIYVRIDVIMLASLRGAEDAGYYNAALRLYEAGVIVPAALTTALFPVMSRQLAGRDMAGLLTSYLQAVRILIILALPIAAAATFYSSWAVELLFGSEYLPAAPALIVLGWSLIIFFVAAPVGNLLAASNLMAKFVPWFAANTGLNIALNFWLIPLYGPRGAALATLITEAVGLPIQLVFVRRILSQWPPLLSLFVRPAIACLAPVGFWLALAGRLQPVLGLVLGLAAYAVALVLVKAVTPEDRRLVGRIVGHWLSPAGQESV